MLPTKCPEGAHLAAIIPAFIISQETAARYPAMLRNYVECSYWSILGDFINFGLHISNDDFMCFFVFVLGGSDFPYNGSFTVMDNELRFLRFCSWRLRVPLSHVFCSDGLCGIFLLAK
jgi:hypothetical protein